MPRRRPTRAHGSSESEEDFGIPSIPPNATNYSFDYTTRSSRIVNPAQPSTSAAARQKPFTRSSASTTPHGRRHQVNEQLSNSRNIDSSPESRQASGNRPRTLHSQNNTESSPERRSTRILKRDVEPAGNRGRKQQEALQNRRKQKKPLSTKVRLLREIKRLQLYDGFLIPRAPFGRLLREVMNDTNSEVTMITKTALEGIQEACEIYLVQVLTDAYALTLHRGRVTLMPKDIQLLRVIRLIE